MARSRGSDFRGDELTMSESNKAPYVRTAMPSDAEAVVAMAADLRFPYSMEDQPRTSTPHGLCATASVADHGSNA